MDVYLGAAAGLILPGRAHVIFHVSAAQNAARIDVFEAGKHFFRRTLSDVRNHVQASPMAHSHHQFHRAILPGAVENFVNQRDERGHAFE